MSSGAVADGAVSRTAAVRRARVALTITDVHKSFDDHEALRGIDLEIRKGEVVALLVLEQGATAEVLDHPKHPTAARFLRVVHTVEV